MRSRLVALALLAGCGGAEPICEQASIDSIEIVTGDPPIVVEENGIVPYVRGDQGLMMAVIGIGYRAAIDPPPCLERTVVVESQTGEPFFEAYPITATEPIGDLHVEPDLWVIEPPFGDLTVNVEAYGRTLRRVVDPTHIPSFAALEGPASASAGVPFDVTLELMHATPRPILLRVTALSANVQAPESIGYGESGATISVTASGSGPLEVTVEDVTSSLDPPPSITTSIDVQ